MSAIGATQRKLCSRGGMGRKMEIREESNVAPIAYELKMSTVVTSQEKKSAQT